MYWTISTGHIFISGTKRIILTASYSASSSNSPNEYKDSEIATFKIIESNGYRVTYKY